MTQGDLTLQEGGSERAQWYTGPAGKSCNDICLDHNQGCNGVITPTVQVYQNFKSNVMCHGAPVSTCGEPTFPTKSSDDQCFFYNQQSSRCQQPRHYFTCCKDGESTCWSPCAGLVTRAEAERQCANR